MPDASKPRAALTETHPELAAQWHPTKNACTPRDLTAGSDKKVWWKSTECEHEWVARVRLRVKGQGCLICSNRQVAVGINDLATTHPDLAVQWHPDQNLVGADEVVAGSYKKAWWRCSRNHEWEAAIAKRAINGRGCPYCSNKKVAPGRNDLATTHPALAAQWHPHRNTMRPTEVTSGTNKLIWWMCELGHEWKATANARTRGGQLSRCPVCINQSVEAGQNDLATTHPHLAAQWHPERNTICPDQVVAGSARRVWWLNDDPSCGHEWDTEIRVRVRGAGCPYCANQRVLSGFNDLKTRNPSLAAHWHPTKNKMGADEVTAVCQQKVWWRDENCGHEWEASVDNRARGNGCPVCSSQRLLSGFNDLATRSPALAAQWHPSRNAVSPAEVGPSSNKKAWWIGECGHEWEATVASRTAGNGCPTCWARSYSSKSEKDLAAYVRGLGVPVSSNYRKLPGVKEVDLYLPECSLAIEYNGVYWHSESRMGRWCHYEKWRTCKALGIRLLQIWESDWVDRQETVKRFLRQVIVGSAGSDAPPAPQLMLTTDVDDHDARAFMDTHNLLGYEESEFMLGLADEELVALGCFKRSGEALELVRFASATDPSWHLGLILAQVRETYPNAREISAYEDHCLADGPATYEALGFRRDRDCPPTFQYRLLHRRYPQSEYPLSRFRDDPKLLWESGLSIAELADLNGLDRVWDAGRTRYVLNLTSFKS